MAFECKCSPCWTKISCVFPMYAKSQWYILSVLKGVARKETKPHKFSCLISTRERNSVLSSLTTQGGDNFNIKYSLVRDRQAASDNFQVCKKVRQAHLTHMKPSCSVAVRYLLNSPKSWHNEWMSGFYLQLLLQSPSSNSVRIHFSCFSPPQACGLGACGCHPVTDYKSEYWNGFWSPGNSCLVLECQTCWK